MSSISIKIYFITGIDVVDMVFRLVQDAVSDWKVVRWIEKNYLEEVVFIISVNTVAKTKKVLTKNIREDVIKEIKI